METPICLVRDVCEAHYGQTISQETMQLRHQGNQASGHGVAGGASSPTRHPRSHGAIPDRALIERFDVTTDPFLAYIPPGRRMRGRDNELSV